MEQKRYGSDRRSFMNKICRLDAKHPWPEGLDKSIGCEQERSGFAMAIAEYRNTTLIKRQNPREFLILRDF
jgi:hypothetical protein